jgi:hypothetical protein
LHERGTFLEDPHSGTVCQTALGYKCAVNSALSLTGSNHRGTATTTFQPHISGCVW